MRGVLNFSKLMGKTPQGIEPMNEDHPPFLIDSSASRAAAERAAADKKTAKAKPQTSKPVSKKTSLFRPASAQAETAQESAAHGFESAALNADGPLGASQLARAEALKTHLDATLDRMQHARSDADQIFTMIADLEAQARQLTGVAQANEALKQSIEAERGAAAELAEKNAELASELARALDERNRARETVEETQKAASALTLTNQQEADRNIAFAAQVSALQAELDTAREAREKAEIDCSSLRAGLSERDQALRALQVKESELRLRAEKDASQIAETLAAAERKERRILELGNAIAKSAKRIEELEEKGERAREEQRQLEVRHSDLQVASESRIFSLTGSLSQEQAGHRVTRKLLEEMRGQSQAIADENKQLKDQAVALAQENQQIKHELGGTRGSIREYGERLGELNLRYTAAQDDIERLEGVIAEGKKEARRLKRQANKVDELQTDNASLLEKVKSLQHTVDQYRAAAQPASDAPILLASRRSATPAEAEMLEVAPVIKLPKAT